jgi:uncharacterized GH25 family protein
MSCGAVVGGSSLEGVNLSKEAVIQGTVLANGAPVQPAYVRLLDAAGEFVAEVPTSERGEFRFFATAGTWTVRVLAPAEATTDTAVSADLGQITEIEVELQRAA